MVYVLSVISLFTAKWNFLKSLLSKSVLNPLFLPMVLNKGIEKERRNISR